MEVNLNRILALSVLLCLGHAEHITLVRNRVTQMPQVPPAAGLTVELASDIGSQRMPVRRFTNLRLFRDFRDRLPLEGRQDLNILVLKVEFVEDDEVCTTGDGKMDLTGFGTPDDGLFYDPPHSGVYFERTMEFLSNYYKVNSFGDCNVTYTVKPDHKRSETGAI